MHEDLQAFIVSVIWISGLCSPWIIGLVCSVLLPTKQYKHFGDHHE